MFSIFNIFLFLSLLYFQEGNKDINISKNSNTNKFPLLLLTLILFFLVTIILFLFSLFVFMSEQNSLLVISEIMSRKLLDKILSIPSFEISKINTIVFKIFLINCSVIICTL